MKFTQYFHAMRLRPDRAIIKIEWIQHVIEHPVKEVIQQDGRICRWAPIDEVEGRYLRVILLPDGETVHNAFLPEIQAMKVKYFQDTDTLYIEFRSVEVAETRDLDENTLLDFDREGNISAITVEHARERAEIPYFSYEQIPA